jgi:hypothetical protein
MLSASLLSVFDDGFEFSAFVEVFWMQQELVAAQALAGLVDGHHAGGIPELQGAVE